MEYRHTPVMLKEIIEYLAPRPGENFIDCTLGGGGYTKAIMDRLGETGKILAIDLDSLAIANAGIKLKAPIENHQLYLAQENFKNLSNIVKKYFSPETKFDGIVFDLGLSSAQLEDRSRGFSFNLADAPLGMNFGEQIEETAENIINNWEIKDLTKIFREYGEEKFAYRITLAIVRERQIERIVTTNQLVKIITEVIPKRFQDKKTHPATKIFQALRLAVNQELDNLRQVLPQAVSLLAPGGKIAVISYHSLEDRIVKQYFREASKDCLCPPIMPTCRCGHTAEIRILTRKVLIPTAEEVLKNPRSRSAKLRVAEKI
ncbi:MAG: 16S rRNA (cytosine(1402)-N(4))-methyltransferase RsmH [bacterium]|nr:16S rRNA (cytosine(1402)-N(4))-methyltransferase RsmH [bacterium]